MAAQDEIPRPLPPVPPVSPVSPAPAPVSQAPVGSARSTARPPSRRTRLFTWLLLLVCLFLAVPALFVEIQTPDVTSADEAYTLLTARGTIEHARQSGGLGSLESWSPYVNGVPQWQHPPALAWVHLVMLGHVKVVGNDIQGFVTRARIVSAIAALLVIAAVFWAAHGIAGVRTATIAGMVCATNPVFIYLGREASPAIFYAAWSLISIAAALWALRPLRPVPSVSRQAIGWTICGLAMGIAVLTSGPGALLGVALPIMLIALICPNRAGHLLGLLAAVLLAVLTFLPWAAYAHYQDADAWPLDWVLWVPVNWFNPEKLLDALSQRTGLTLLSLLPWTLWLIGAIAQPFSTSSKGVRTRLFLGWAWFILATVFMIASPGTGREASLLALIAAGAVLIAEVFNQYVDLAAHGRHPRVWRWLRLPHIVILALASLAIPFGPMLLHWEPWGAMPRQLADPGWFFSIGLCVALLGIVGLSVRWAYLHFPAKALAAWAVWSSLFIAAIMLLLVRGPTMVAPALRKDAAWLARAVEGSQVFWWGTPRTDPAQDFPALLLYSGQTPTVLSLDRIKPQREHGMFFLIAPRSGPLPSSDSGASAVMNLPDAGVVLYRCESLEPPEPPETPTTRPISLSLPAGSLELLPDNGAKHDRE